MDDVGGGRGGLPGIVALVVVPLVVYRLCPPGLHGHQARTASGRRASARRWGRPGGNEAGDAGRFSRPCSCSGCRPSGMAPRRPRLRTSGWRCCLSRACSTGRMCSPRRGAWDALIWFGGLVMLAGQLDKAGLPKAFAGGGSRPGRRVGRGGGRLAALMAVYLYSHYAFASLVAHVTAMFPAFFAVGGGASAHRRC